MFSFIEKILLRQQKYQDKIIKETILAFGFERDDEFSYSYEDSIGINMLSIDEKSMYIHAISKVAAFSDSGTMPLPIKSKQSLVDFLNGETICESD